MTDDIQRDDDGIEIFPDTYPPEFWQQFDLLVEAIASISSTFTNKESNND